MKKFVITILAISFFLASCTKEEKEENKNRKPVANFTVADNIDMLYFKSASTDDDLDTLRFQWFVDCDSLTVSDNTKSYVYFKYPAISEKASLKVKLTVSDGKDSDSIIKNIELTPYDNIRKFGLGTELISEKSNNVVYSWYIDQLNTGVYSNINCGPTSVTMAIKWAQQNFTKTPEDARNTYRSAGGWWYTDDIINYLDLYAVSNKTISLFRTSTLKDELNKGNIAILCLDMFYIRKENKAIWHTDKFYHAETKGWGHFIVVKGYKEVDDEMYYEAYDPNSLNVKYADKNLKGMDRYYRSADIDSATYNWWNYAVIVSKAKRKSMKEGLDVLKIKHMPGR